GDDRRGYPRSRNHRLPARVLQRLGGRAAGASSASSGRGGASQSGRRRSRTAVGWRNAVTDAGQAEDTRPIHCRPVSFALAFLGGTAGTAVREAISLTWDGDVPYAIGGINIAGAFLLGVLLDALARRGPDHG